MNLYQLFQDLIPKQVQIVAVVQAEFADGTTACLTLDNQPIRVKGVAGRTLGTKVFITIDPRLGSTITGTAPNLTAYSIEV